MLPYPDDEIGLVVASEQLLGRSDQAALILRVAVAYTAGVRLAMSALLRDEAGARWNDDMTSANGDGLELAVRWSDDRDGPTTYRARRAIGLQWRSESHAHHSGRGRHPL